MRIAQVSLQYGKTVTGGGGVHVEKIVEYLLKEGHEVTVLSLHTAPTMAGGVAVDEHGWSTERETSPRVVRCLVEDGIADPYVGDKAIELDRILAFSKYVVAWVRAHEDELDVVHMHGHHAVCGYVAEALQDTAVRTVATIHYLESTNVTATRGGLMHYQIDDVDLERMKGWEAATRFADVPVVISPGQRDDFTALLEERGVDPAPALAKLRLVSSGIDPDSVLSTEAIEAKLASQSEPVRILSFARLDPVKGVEYAVQGAALAAASLGRKATLTVAGVPEEEIYVPVLEREVKKANETLPVDMQVFDGIFTPADRDAFLDQYDVYLFPTLREPFGITVVEAGARGLAVITTDSPGPLYILDTVDRHVHDWGIETEYGVMLKRTDDPERNLTGHVAKGLRAAFADRDATAERVRKFHRYVIERWTWPGVVNEYLDAYRG